MKTITKWIAAMLMLAIIIATVYAFTGKKATTHDGKAAQANFYRYTGDEGDNNWNEMSKWEETPSSPDCPQGDNEICGVELTGDLGTFLSGHNATSYEDALELQQIVTRQ